MLPPATIENLPEIVPVQAPAQPEGLAVHLARNLIYAFGLVTAPLNLVATVCMGVLGCTAEAASLIGVIFYRMIVPAKYDVRTARFAETLKNLGEENVSLQQEFFAKAEALFKSDFCLKSDLQELEALNQRIQRRLDVLEEYATVTGRTPLLPIHQQVLTIQTKFTELKESYEAYIILKRPTLLRKFIETTAMFVQLRVPISHCKDVYREIEEIWQLLKSVCIDGKELSEQEKALFQQAKVHRSDLMKLSRGNSTKKGTIEPDKPLQLKRLGTTSSYMNSVLQSLLNSQTLVDHLRHHSPPRNHYSLEQYKKLMAIRQELLYLVDPVHTEIPRQLSYLQLLLLLKKELTKGSNENLRSRIFRSGLNPEFTPGKLARQFDAASLMKFFINEGIFPCAFTLKKCLIPEELLGPEWITTETEEPMLQLSCKIDPKTQQVPSRLRDLIRLNLREMNDIPAGFYPKGAEHLEGAEVQFDETYDLQTLPPVMVIQLLPQAGEGNDVQLPRNGIVNLTSYYGPNKGKEKKSQQPVKYKIKSFIVHSGDKLDAGNNVTYVEKKGLYYLCDDSNPGYYKPIEKEEFLSQKRPYLIVMERIII